MPGESVCAHGHAQSVPALTSFDLISATRSARPANSGTGLTHATPQRGPTAAPASACGQSSAYLHISGFDPRAAGGRQAIKIELRDMPAHCPPQLTLQLQSALLAHGAARHTFLRTTRGDWRPLFIEFSSRNLEHGQYRIDVELHSLSDGKPSQKWVCTLLILVPRADATLSDIHQIFLSTHKNVRVLADDASIATVRAQSTGGRLDIDVHARNASIAHLDLDPGNGKLDMGFASIAWDEDLIEIDVPSSAQHHPHPSRAACLVNAAPQTGAQRQIRLFALDECMLGRFEAFDPEADVLLTHFGEDGQDRDGLTRRLSARHAIIRRGRDGFEIEDVSRYGLLIDGVWPGKGKPVALRLGMRIELSASIKGIVVLTVSALLAHGVIMHRIDQGCHAECFYFLAPDTHPGFPPTLTPQHATPAARALPLLYHDHGGFWHLDPATGKETALSTTTSFERLCQVPKHLRFSADPYPESWVERSDGLDHFQLPLAERVHNAFISAA